MKYFTAKTILLFIIVSIWTKVYSQGTVMVVGIDTEEGVRPLDNSHGSISYWANVINTGLLSNVTNGKSDILVIGGRSGTNDVKNFWNQVSSTLGRSVTYKHSTFWTGTSQIRNVNFNNYALIVIVTDGVLSGYLRQSELNTMNNRVDDVKDFLCNGGALFSSSCEMSNPYGYLSKFGSISTSSYSYTLNTPTIDGIAVGLNTVTMPNGPWHMKFNSFPPYLKILSNETDTNNISAIGGKNVSVAKADFSLTKSEFCLGEIIMANPAISTGAVSYFWSIQESDVNWNRYGTEITQWFNGTPPNNFNITDFINSKKIKLQCNKYYRIKLAISGLCTSWDETTKLIFVKCPELKPMQPECCPGSISGALEIGTGPFPQNCIYSWSPSNLVLNPTSPVTLFNPSSTTSYPVTLTLTATDNSGCQNSQKLEICCGKPEINIVENKNSCCNSSLTVNNKNTCLANEILWSNGSKENTINVSQSGTYTVTVKNPCGVSTQSINVVLNGSNVPFANEVAIFPNANAIEPYSSNPLRRVMRIKHYDRPENEIPSYNATYYEFRIFNLWGGVIYEKKIENCNGFANGEILWDGRDNTGNLVSADVFTWKLDLKNCGNPIVVKTAHPIWNCLEWRRPWWCFWDSCRECVTSEWQPNYNYNNTGSVTVVY